jgi:hypothetical protein
MCFYRRKRRKANILNTMQQYSYHAFFMQISRALIVIALVALAVAGGACSKNDATPPVASISLTTSSKRVALGSPVEITYKFQVAPDAKIDGDYRVFVHVNRDDGTTIWNDDHELPAGKATSTWKPGQTIEYTRTRFVPSFSYVGQATIQMGLYRDNVRLPLSGPDPADRESRERAYKVATLELLPRSENVQVIRLNGWHKVEYAADDAGIDWQWMQKQGTLSFRNNPRRDVLFYLEFDGRSDLFQEKPQTVTVYVGNEAVSTFGVPPIGSTSLQKIPITAAQLGTGEMAEIRLDVDQTFVPARLPGGSKDQRELGIRVYHAFIEPR